MVSTDIEQKNVKGRDARIACAVEQFLYKEIK